MRIDQRLLSDLQRATSPETSPGFFVAGRILAQ
jgi:hypothetical protein